jgi:predicted nucleic acid-binding Zn ribbon protein
MEGTMTRKAEATPNVTRTQTEAEIAADKVRAERQAKRAAKAAAAAAKAAVKKPAIGRQADLRKNAFGIAASASKATAVSRSIISRARGGRGR